MPKTKDGWTLDDTPMFTDEQWAEIQSLLAEGKQAEAEALISSILKGEE